MSAVYAYFLVLNLRRVAPNFSTSDGPLYRQSFYETLLGPLALVSNVILNGVVCYSFAMQTWVKTCNLGLSLGISFLYFFDELVVYLSLKHLMIGMKHVSTTTQFIVHLPSLFANVRDFPSRAVSPNTADLCTLRLPQSFLVPILPLESGFLALCQGSQGSTISQPSSLFLWDHHTARV